MRDQRAYGKSEILVADAVVSEVESINTDYTDQSGRQWNRIRKARHGESVLWRTGTQEFCLTVSYDSLVARAIAVAMRPVTRQALVKRLRLAQQVWSRSLPSKVISSERAVPF